MKRVWGVGLNHCGQIGPDFLLDEVESPGLDASMSPIHEVDAPGATAAGLLWKPNACCRVQEIPVCPEDEGEWEVTDVCAGGDFTVCHGRQRNAQRGAQTWICGNLTHGRFCFSSCVLDKLTPLPTLAGMAVRSMSCGRAHTLLAAENGTVYSWGWNLYGQLGHGTSGDVYSPQRIEHFHRAGASARKVCCGEGFSIVVCSEGLYSFGCNHQGQLGLGYAWATSCCNTPQRVCLDAQQVACGYMHNADASSLEVACGGHHTLVLRSHSFASPAELFAWGLNTEGQCGVGIKGEVTA
jgi:hypothetical protein